MFGSIIGDIVGSRFEFDNNKSKDFELFTPECDFTDDTICTVATMDWLNNGLRNPYQAHLLKWCRKYPNPTGGYGARFSQWCHINSKIQKPYNSFGNGSAMRVSPVALYSDRITSVLDLAERTAIVTHNHKEGIKGAKATAHVIFLAREGCPRNTIKSVVEDKYGYDLSESVDEIRECYEFNESCQWTVPQSIVCFLESNGFEDAIRNAISIGGDSDTIACIVGGMAEAYYGIPQDIMDKASAFLPKEMKEVKELYYERL